MAFNKYLILLPVRSNDGQPIPQAILNGILGEIFDLAGGWNMGSAVEGAFRMSDGSEQRDTCKPVSVVLDPRKVQLLKEIVRRAGAILGQEKMYFEQTGGQVEFLDPDPREDVKP